MIDNIAATVIIVIRQKNFFFTKPPDEIQSSRFKAKGVFISA
jgi:hypothetical protein